MTVSFECISRTIDAHKESMAGSCEEAVAGVTSSRISHMEVPDCFTDEQLSGPFKFFRHAHEFSEDGGITTMVDRIEFAAPLGPLGLLVEKLFLARYMKNLIEARNRHLTGAGVEIS